MAFLDKGWSYIFRKMLQQMGMVDHIETIVWKRQTLAKVMNLNIWTGNINIDVRPTGVEPATAAQIQIFHGLSSQPLSIALASLLDQIRCRRSHGSFKEHREPLGERISISIPYFDARQLIGVATPPNDACEG